MIVKVEQILTTLFDTIPEYNGNNKLFFGTGDQKELNSVLLMKQKNETPCYPLLWYVMPNRLKGSDSHSEGICSFVLAHNSEIALFNDQRYETIFNTVLYPYFSLVIQALQAASNINMFYLDNDNFWDYLNAPNYGNPLDYSGGNETQQVDVWDAIEFKVNLRIMPGTCGYDRIVYDLDNLQ